MMAQAEPREVQVVHGMPERAAVGVDPVGVQDGVLAVAERHDVGLVEHAPVDRRVLVGNGVEVCVLRFSDGVSPGDEARGRG